MPVRATSRMEKGRIMDWKVSSLSLIHICIIEDKLEPAGRAFQQYVNFIIANAPPLRKRQEGEKYGGSAPV